MMENETKKNAPEQEQSEQTSAAQEEKETAQSGEEAKAEEQKPAQTADEEAAALRRELEDVKDRLLRSLAEYDNYRKRSTKEKENAYRFSKADTLTKLLPVIDNFERAAENETASFEDYKKGILMIHSQFKEILANLGVESYGEKGEIFDPNIHSAVMHVEDEAYGEGEILDVFAKGYRLGDQILRPASVRVAN